LALLTLVIALVGASAAEPATPIEGVSRITVSPLPFYEDVTRMVVRVTTTGPAGPNRNYEVYVTGDVPMSIQKREHCTLSNGGGYHLFRGGVGVTTTKVLTPDTSGILEEGPTGLVTTPTDHFCPAAAQIVVVSILRNDKPIGKHTRVLFRYHFRILRRDWEDEGGATAPEPTQKTPTGLGIPVTKRKDLLGALRRIVRSVKPKK